MARPHPTHFVLPAETWGAICLRRGHLVGFARPVQARTVVVANRAVDARAVVNSTGLGDAGNFASSFSMGRTAAGICWHVADSSRAHRLRADLSSALACP